MNSSPKIIFNLQYRYTQYTKKKLNAKQEKKRINTQDAFEYYDRDEACDKTINTQDAFDYYDYRVGSEGGFNDKGNIGAVHSQELCEQYKPEVIYRGVVSFDRQFAMDNGIIEKEKMKKLIQKSMNSILKRLEMNPDNIEWCAFYHTNTEHPHCHINFYEKERTRKMERYSKKQLERVRSEIVSLLEVNTQMYIRKDETFKRLVESISKIEPLLTNELIHAGNNSMKLQSKGKIVKKFCELEQVLPKEGSMKYNSKNIRPYHNQIRNLLKDIFNDEQVKPFYDQYIDVLNQLKSAQEELYGTGESIYVNGDKEVVKGVEAGRKDINEYQRRRLYELETRVANMLLQNIVMVRKDMQDFQPMKKTHFEIMNNHTIDDTEILDFHNDKTQTKEELSKTTVRNKSVSRETKERKRNFKIRYKVMKAGVIRELAQEIQNMDYALKKEQNKVREVTQKAQQEIYARY